MLTIIFIEITRLTFISIYPSIYPSIRPSIRLSVHPSVHPSMFCALHQTIFTSEIKHLQSAETNQWKHFFRLIFLMKILSISNPSIKTTSSQNLEIRRKTTKIPGNSKEKNSLVYSTNMCILHFICIHSWKLF